MVKKIDETDVFTELAQKAQLGDKDSLNFLAERIRERLFEFIYRTTLNEDLSRDLVQDSLLDMIRDIHTLKRADRIWPWLCGIALNKYYNYCRAQRNKTVAMPILAESYLNRKTEKSESEGLEHLMRQEMKQIVLSAMKQLKSHHRAILTMRCYNNMDYDQIGAALGCSTFSAHVRFYRAKNSLKKNLTRHGMNKAALLSALIVFGKMTAQSEASAAQVAVTAGTVKVSAVATLAAQASSKTAVAAYLLSGTLAVGTLVGTYQPDQAKDHPQVLVANNSNFSVNMSPSQEAHQENWYYYPDGTQGSLMMLQKRSKAGSTEAYCQYLQNDQANYLLDNSGNTVHITNYRMWNPDLSVSHLPTDSPELANYLSFDEDYYNFNENLRPEGSHFLIVDRKERTGWSPERQLVYNYNFLEEQYFRDCWPAEVKFVDQRDLMHQRGWTYFRLEGNLAELQLSGQGRIPFVYKSWQEHSPWLKLKISDQFKIVDTDQGSGIVNASDNLTAAYPSESFFMGLSRPWMGLHTIDTIRRDAAGQMLATDIKYLADKSKAQIELQTRQQNHTWKLLYTVDMAKDLVDKITYYQIDNQDGAEDKQGELVFSYLQEIDTISSEFVRPDVADFAEDGDNLDMFWVLQLVLGETVK